LISKDRDDEAFAILAKYHAEGDASSVLVQAEMAQIRSVVKLEMEHSKQSWMDMVRTPGMRRRVLISAFLGLFTQMSGNTLLSYYQNLLFVLMGYTSDYAKTRINIANQCWSLINGVTIALVVTRFRRRWMFMLSASSMTLVFMAMTICFQRLRTASDNHTTNKPAQIASLFFFFAYSPCYNIGNNSLTYTYLVEIFPYAQRTMGIGIEQFFGKAAGFFSVNVNPIALTAIDWKYLAIYCGWITFELTFVYFMYPETYNRTLEELTFCKFCASDCGMELTIIQCLKIRRLPIRRCMLSRSRSMRRILWAKRRGLRRLSGLPERCFSFHLAPHAASDGFTCMRYASKGEYHYIFTTLFQLFLLGRLTHSSTNVQIRLPGIEYPFTLTHCEPFHRSEETAKPRMLPTSDPQSITIPPHAPAHPSHRVTVRPAQSVLPTA
jgi:hypothetical protein